MVLYLRLLPATVHRAGTPRRDLLWENLALRQQLGCTSGRRPGNHAYSHGTDQARYLVWAIRGLFGVYGEIWPHASA